MGSGLITAACYWQGVPLLMVEVVRAGIDNPVLPNWPAYLELMVSLLGDTMAQTPGTGWRALKVMVLGFVMILVSLAYLDLELEDFKGTFATSGFTVVFATVFGFRNCH